jgi:hypothetical protein
MEVFHFSRTPTGVHYTTPAYGPSAPWPADRPATFVPIALHPTRYARDAIGPAPRVVVVLPRSQNVPARTLGGHGVWDPRYAAPHYNGLGDEAANARREAARVDPKEVKEFKADVFDSLGRLIKENTAATVLLALLAASVVATVSGTFGRMFGGGR